MIFYFIIFIDKEMSHAFLNKFDLKKIVQFEISKLLQKYEILALFRVYIVN